MILVVDDKLEIAELMVEVCKLAGYYSDFCLHGAQAIYKLQRITYSLAFIDIILPGGMDGNQLAAQIKRLPEPFCRVPLVAMTGSNADESVDRDLFVHRIQKPFLPREIRSVIEQFANPPIPDLLHL